MPADELAALKARLPEKNFKQEYEAEFVSWAGDSYFDLDQLFVSGKPMPDPVSGALGCIVVAIDTAMKTGKDGLRGLCHAGGANRRRGDCCRVFAQAFDAPDKLVSSVPVSEGLIPAGVAAVALPVAASMKRLAALRACFNVGRHEGSQCLFRVPSTHFMRITRMDKADRASA